MPAPRSWGRPKPKPHKLDTNREPKSRGAGRGNPEDTTLVSVCMSPIPEEKSTRNQLNNQTRRTIMQPLRGRKRIKWEKNDPKRSLKCPRRGMRLDPLASDVFTTQNYEVRS